MFPISTRYFILIGTGAQLNKSDESFSRFFLIFC
jgi:hypothetical protein